MRQAVTQREELQMLSDISRLILVERWLMVPDFGEAALAPLEGMTEGTLVADEVDGWGSPLREPIRFIIKAGKVVQVAGGDPKEVARFEEVLRTDSNASAIAEFAMGSSHLVPARLTGCRYDLGHLETCHVAVGRNSAIGGKIKSAIHWTV